MLNSMLEAETDDVNRHFKKLVDLIEDDSVFDELDLMIIYVYATYLEDTGKGSQSLAYYKLIRNNINQNTTLKTISTLSISGMTGNPDVVLRLVESLNLLSTDLFSADDKMTIIIKASTYLKTGSPYKLFKKYKSLYRQSNNKVARFNFLLFLQFHFSENLDPEGEDIWIELEKSSSDTNSSRSIFKWRLATTKRLMSQGKYDEALSKAKENVSDIVGDFTDNNELLNKTESLEKVPHYILANYAFNNLLQTRLGKGLPPVIDAFNIYEASYKRRLVERIKNVNTITPERDLSTTGSPHDILIVGVYLYQNTKNIDYLNRTYSIVNGMTSGGISYWAEIRSLMRENGSIEKNIQKEQELVTAIRETSNNVTLSEIYNRQVALKEFRENTQQNQGEFYNDVMDSYQVDLKDIQQKMKRDTAACLNFFIADEALYRLYVSPDTIDVLFIEDDARIRSLKLTEQLSTMVESGKSAAMMEEASRELYGHLFAGIEDDLPPNLHLIVNGALLNVPFSVLQKDKAGENPRYLGVEHAISRQFSLGTMKLLEETELSPRYAQPLAMAPNFANELLQAGELRQAGFQLPPLVYNGEELRNMQSRGSGDYLYDEKATLARYQDRAADYGIIHLATHAISSEIDGLRSRVYLLDDVGKPIGLYAGDIGKQTLNSELVVLSACETGGGGTHYVEGRIGLTKAYLAAGARSVVASNWAVDDHATAEQMKTFYDGIEAGRPPHVALQGARKAYLEAHPDAAPYKWVAFEAYGGMRPVRWDKDAGTGNWWWLALPVLGVGAVVAWNRKQRASRAA